MGYTYFVLALLGLIILIFIFQYLNSKKSDKIFLLKLIEDYGKSDRSSYDIKRLTLAPGYYLKHRNQTSVDDITWADLSMDEVFKEIDTTQSDIGSQILYFYLRNPLFSESQIQKRAENISFWMNNESLRSLIGLALHHCGANFKYSLYSHLDKLNELKNKPFSKYLFHICLLIASLISIFFLNGIGVIIFIFVLVFNFTVYYKEKSEIIPYISVFGRIISLLDAADEIKGIYSKNNMSNEASELETVCQRLNAIKRGSFFFRGSSMESNPFVFVLNLFGSLIFADLIIFYHYKNVILSHSADIDELFYKVGEIDALIAISSYVYGKGTEICKPEFVDKDINISNVYHPLIDNTVKNDLCTKKAVLITGANASGKSTFLKAIAVNILFSEVFGYVLADKWECPVALMYSSMSIKDDVCAGDSYYMAEIKSVKRILDAKKLADELRIPQIVFVDELLNGTNTEERIAASTQILKKMVEEGLFVFAATHDIELTDLLKDNFDNYHFSEDLSQGDVVFSYKIMNGKATSRNAIRLLGSLDFPEEIITEANNMVANHLETGNWKLMKG